MTLFGIFCKCLGQNIGNYILDIPKYKFVIENFEKKGAEALYTPQALAQSQPSEYDEKLAKAIMLSLGCEELAISRIMKECSVAYPRGYELSQKLHELNLLDAERPNKPRKTIIRTVEDIFGSDEISKLLTTCGYAEHDISAAIAKRVESKASIDSQ